MQDKRSIVMCAAGDRFEKLAQNRLKPGAGEAFRVKDSLD